MSSCDRLVDALHRFDEVFPRSHVNEDKDLAEEIHRAIDGAEEPQEIVSRRFPSALNTRVC